MEGGEPVVERAVATNRLNDKGGGGGRGWEGTGDEGERRCGKFKLEVSICQATTS